jgi:response regulator RpfG family c-di-GMP phosphodiesterase
MNKKKIYKKRWKYEDVFRFLKEERGKYFNLNFFDSFIDDCAYFVAIRVGLIYV